MKLNLDMPHTVYVIVGKDRRGFRRGFEKAVNGRFYLNYAEAVDALREAVAPGHGLFYIVAECVIGYPDEISPPSLFVQDNKYVPGRDGPPDD